MTGDLWVMERAGFFYARAAFVLAAEPWQEMQGRSAFALMAELLPEPQGRAVTVPAEPQGRAATAPVEPGQEARTLELTDSEVIVRAPDGTEIQRIPFDAGELTEFNRDYFMTTPDINFDGWPDLLLIASQGLQNVYYDGWIWDPDAGRYVYEPQVRGLSSPVFDDKTHLITTYEHGSATDHVSGVWAWQNGRLIEIERQEQTYDDATGLFTIRTYRLNSDGKLSLVDTQTLTEAQMNSD
jgi:hypothetical protein